MMPKKLRFSVLNAAKWLYLTAASLFVITIQIVCIFGYDRGSTGTGRAVWISRGHHSINIVSLTGRLVVTEILRPEDSPWVEPSFGLGLGCNLGI